MVQETSINAYHDIAETLGQRQEIVLEEIRKHTNITNSELAESLRWPINTVTPRTNELVAKGRVYDDCKRKCEVTGRIVIAWAAKKGTLF